MMERIVFLNEIHPESNDCADAKTKAFAVREFSCRGSEFYTNHSSLILTITWIDLTATPWRVEHAFNHVTKRCFPH